ncbi:MAG TPA: L,D-transpeptidase family protein [Thermoleophilaceae bacterium]
MIEPEQLAGALERLDPRDRELLALSLRRRVPDEALARVYDVDSQEVARRRASAIERLADELGAQRGVDLGAVLQALLDEGAWSAAELGSENGEAERDVAEPDAAAPEVAEEPSSAPAALQEVEPDTEPDSTNGKPPVVPVASEPVLEMLAAREGVRGPDGTPEQESADDKRRVPYLIILASFVAAVLGGAAALVGSSGCGNDGGVASLRNSGHGTKHFVPQLGGPLEAPFPSEPQSISCYSTALIRGPTTLYREPGGRVRIRLSAKTEWGSPRVLGVVLRRGDWVGVQAPELDNNELAWLPANRARLDCVTWSMNVDLSRRVLSVRRDGKVVRRYQIAIGRRGNPTPKGRFSVTDKLRVSDPGSPYGCCVLALTGHQTRLPAAWPGGDRLAVHATTELSSLGKPASLGCMRLTSVQARWLIKTIPLGAPLFVRA